MQQVDIGSPGDSSIVCDVLVAGSGAGGFAAAVAARAHGLDVLIVEKESHFGGTTARSGGWLWVPGNPIAAREGIRYSKDDAMAYIASEAGEYFDPDIAEAYLTYGPRMISFFEKQTSVKFSTGDPRPDYHLEKPGAVENGRSLFIDTIDGRVLGPMLDRLTPPVKEMTFADLRISGPELRHFLNATHSFADAMFVLRHLTGHVWDLLRYGRRYRLVTGNALIARLAKSAFDLGVPLWLSSEVRELIIENGAVRGAIVIKEGKPLRIMARRGVVLACGGLPHDKARMLGLYSQRSPEAKFTLASPASAGDTGDGIRLGESADGQFDNRFSTVSYSAPTSFVPLENGTSGLFIHLFDYHNPGFMVVTRQGKRFVNEARVYHDVAQAIINTAEPGNEVAAFIICDHRAIRRHGLGFAKPFPVPLGSYLRSGYLMRSKTIEGLAKKAGIAPDELMATVATFNQAVREGRQARAGNGNSHGHPLPGAISPEIIPDAVALDRPPYYAVRVVPGDLGTLVGLRTNRHAQVLNKGGEPIVGLYAAGNDMASLFGGSSPGAGGTLGPAMTFGYVAGLHLTGNI